jgi:hypothetical protein
VASTELQGWYEDPFRLHQARYFSAGRPTKLVRDGNVESYDEPPVSGTAAASSGRAVGATLNRAEVIQAQGPDPWGEDVPAYTRGRPRGRVFTAVAALAIGGGVTAAVLVGKPGPATVPVTEAMAYTATMNASSADVYLSYGITSADHKLDATSSESGPLSWSAGQGNLAVKGTLSGRPFITGQEIIDGRKTYSKTLITYDKALAKDLPASPSGWTETTWTGTSSQDKSGFMSGLLFGRASDSAGNASPASLLELLNAQASSVQELGGEPLDGVSTTHYRALIPLSRLGAGTAEEEVQLQQALGTSFLGVDYWLDSAHLLRQLRFVITALPRPSATTTSSSGAVTITAGTAATTSTVTLRLSNYGTPVHVIPPPPAQITRRVTCVVSGDGFSCPG